MVDRFKERILLNSAAADNTGAGLALEFKAQAGEINTWFDVLKDKDTAAFMRRALGLPNEIVQVDIDRQVELFKAKFDITKLKDPAEVDRLVKRFSAVYDALEGVNTVSNAAISLMQGAVAAGQGGGFNIVTLDISAVVQGGFSRYR